MVCHPFALRLCTATLLLAAALQVGSAAELNYPLAIAANDAGEIYLADRNLPGVWKIKDGVLSLYFEGSKKFRTPLNAVRCLAFDKDGKLLAGDSSTREVYRFDEAGKPVPLTSGGIGIPMSIAVNKAGELFVADLELHRLWKVPESGGKPEKFAEVAAPCGLCFDEAGNLWVVSRGKEQVFKVSPEGRTEVVVKSRVMNFPHNIALDKSGTAFITDGYEKAVWKLAPDSEPAKWVSGPPFDNPVGICLHGEKLLVVDPRARAVFQIDKEGLRTKLGWKIE
jgi:DNA-binding beta-propeller fold protein YncE